MFIRLGLLSVLGMISLVGVLAVAAPTALAAGVDEPAYTLLSKSGGVELRQYAPLIRAETVVDGRYEDSVTAGFRILAGYIFGNNDGGGKIAMTAPVGAQPEGAKIAMTAPVGAEPTEAGWRVSFVMPAAYTLGTLPRPLDDRVLLREVPTHRVAALRFSGRADTRTVEQQKVVLAAALDELGLVAAEAPQVAQYNPPWTPPFLRRNELLVSVVERG